MDDDDQVMERHPLSCAVWSSDDPCTCGSAEFTASVDALLATFERHAPNTGQAT